jgi:hypothetical protein
MAFGISREELNRWKRQVSRGEIAYLTHYWLHPKYPGITTVTKVGCADLPRLRQWVVSHGLNANYIHQREAYPHFDLIGAKQKEILEKERQWEQLARFGICGQPDEVPSK